jgi:hypothetical protein
MCLNPKYLDKHLIYKGCLTALLTILQLYCGGGEIRRNQKYVVKHTNQQQSHRSILSYYYIHIIIHYNYIQKVIHILYLHDSVYGRWVLKSCVYMNMYAGIKHPKVSPAISDIFCLFQNNILSLALSA